LQYEQGIVPTFPHASWSAATVCGADEPMTESFVAKLEDFVAGHDIRW